MTRIIATSLSVFLLALGPASLAHAQGAGNDVYQENVPSAGGDESGGGSSGGGGDSSSSDSGSQSSGGDSSAGTSSSGTSSSSGTTSTAPAPTTSSTGSAPTEAAGNLTNTGSGGGKSLPSTGSDAWLLGLAGVVLLAAGLWARRRAQIEEIVAELADRPR